MKLTPTDEAAMGTVTAELPAAPDDNGWMPIEDSKGGEIIAGWWSAGVWMIRAAWWFDGSRWKDQGFDCHDDAMGWWSYVNSVGQEKIHPTHFLPHTALPNPPKE